MTVALYSSVFALVSFYRLLLETYRQELTLVIGGAAILITGYLRIQARYRAQLARLEQKIAAVSGELDSQKQSFSVGLDDLKNLLLDAQKEEAEALKAAMEGQLLRTMTALQSTLDAQEAGFAAQKQDIDALKAGAGVQKDGMVTMKGILDAQKIVLQAEINRILAWLGTTPYLANPATESLRGVRNHYTGNMDLMMRHNARQRQDISETAMRKTIDMAFPQ